MSAIGVHHTATTSAPWDGPMNEAHCPSNESALRASHAWRDPNGDPAIKASYKFIHHMVSAEGSVGAADTIGCSTGIGYLNHPPGTTGRPNIPAADRAGVYAHLAAHIKDADMTPPDLRAMMAMPTDAAAMRAHMEAAPPPGHGMDAAAVADMSMADMQAKHDAMHGAGAGHTHPGMGSMNSAPRPRELRIATEAWPMEDLEFRAEGDGMAFRGYAAVFDKWSEDLGGFRERIRPGAFAKSLSSADKRAIKMFWNHNTDIPLGTTKSGLTLTEDAKGLLAEGRLPDTTAGRDMSTLIKSGIVDSMSFGFQTVRDDYPEGPTKRDLIEAKLYEVSPVTAWPAYPQTSASVRELAAEIDVDPDELAGAFVALRATDIKITEEQFDLLQALINARSARQLVRPQPVDSWWARLEPKALATVQ